MITDLKPTTTTTTIDKSVGRWYGTLADDARVRRSTAALEANGIRVLRAPDAAAAAIDPPRPLVITNQSSTLTPGTRGSAYATNLFADGGIPPYTWAIVAGQLPPGLSLSGNRIEGTPTTAGTFTFTARVRDSGGQQASRQFSITVT